MIGPWKLAKGAAQALDAFIAFGTQAAAARYLGLSESTVNTQLRRITLHVYAAGETLRGSTKEQLQQITVLWQNYWWSDEGKASLRNPQLTRNPLA